MFIKEFTHTQEKGNQALWFPHEIFEAVFLFEFSSGVNNGREKAVRALCLLHLGKVGKQHSDTRASEMVDGEGKGGGTYQ